MGTSACQIHKHLCLAQVPGIKPEPTREINFDNELIIDTGVTFSSIRNKSLLAGVYDMDNHIQMCTNTGERTITKRGVLLGMKNDPWLDEELMVNILSFCELTEQYRITYDSNKADCFYCHTETRIVEFQRTKQGLYSVPIPDGYKEEVMKKNSEGTKKCLIHMVAENRKNIQ